MKIFDCITFFRENFITNIRFEILKDCVDYFFICESMYDHKGNKKQLNFKLLNKNLKNKVIYVVKKDKFSKLNTPWQNQATQREYLKNFVFNYSRVRNLASRKISIFFGASHTPISPPFRFANCGLILFLVSTYKQLT